MGNYKNIIFDLDGTLTDSLEGIFNSLVYALKQLGYSEIPESMPTAFLGPPLQQGFKNIFNLNSAETEIAVKYFRDYYGSKGLFENQPYKGISELLAALANNGTRMFVATSKYEKYAWEIIKHFEFDKYIDDLKGADYGGNYSKTDLIKIIIDKHSLKKPETIMVGDTVHDIEGAREAGIKCIAVGYGFNSRETLLAANPDFYVDNVEELGEIILD
jgi:phosphoglycolate phosphatase